MREQVIAVVLQESALGMLRIRKLCMVIHAQQDHITSAERKHVKDILNPREVLKNIMSIAEKSAVRLEEKNIENV